jgi:DNA excision repair protein ERCC-2
MKDIDLPSRIKMTDASKLQDEYAKLVEGLQEAASNEDAFMSNPGLHRTPVNDCSPAELWYSSP